MGIHETSDTQGSRFGGLYTFLTKERQFGLGDDKLWESNWKTYEEKCYFSNNWASLVAQWVKGLPAMQETHADDEGLIPGSGRSPGAGNDNPLQYSHLGNPVDRGIWQVTVHGVAKSWA